MCQNRFEAGKKWERMERALFDTTDFLNAFSGHAAATRARARMVRTKLVQTRFVIQARYRRFFSLEFPRKWNAAFIARHRA